VSDASAPISADGDSPDARRDISDTRKFLYYGGYALTGIGVLGFLLNMIFSAGIPDDFDDIEGKMQRMMATALCMIVLLGIGVGMTRVGQRGLAGAGVILDPQRARSDLEPWSRMGGGALSDALDEAKLGEQITKAIAAASGPDRTVVVKVRCPACGELDDEDAKFCSACSEPMQTTHQEE